jgi:hypothetical protein
MQQSSTTVTMTAPNVFNSLSISRDQTTVSAVVQLTLDFKITNQITSSSSYLLLTLSYDQL